MAGAAAVPTAVAQSAPAAARNAGTAAEQANEAEGPAPPAKRHCLTDGAAVQASASGCGAGTAAQRRKEQADQSSNQGQQAATEAGCRCSWIDGCSGAGAGAGQAAPALPVVEHARGAGAAMHADDNHQPLIMREHLLLLERTRGISVSGS